MESQNKEVFSSPDRKLILEDTLKMFREQAERAEEQRRVAELEAQEQKIQQAERHAALVASTLKLFSKEPQD